MHQAVARGILTTMSDSTPAPQTAAPGWYPIDAATQRYWDGAAWGEARPLQLVVPQAQIVSDRHGAEVRAGGGTVAWVLALVTLGYLIPWAIAVTRGKANSTAILLVNLLLGWTVVGWIIALVMASTSHQKFVVQR